MGSVSIVKQLFFTALVSAAFAVPAYKPKDNTGLTIKIVTDGTFNVSVDGTVWLPSAPTYFYADGTKYSSADGSLKLVQCSVTSGEDKLGQWQDTIFKYNAGGNVVWAIIRTYQDLDIILFSQRYGNLTKGTSSGSSQTLSSAFPSFQINPYVDDIGYLSYGGGQFGSTSVKIGRWIYSIVTVNSGIEGGPLILFDQNQNVIIQSPFNQFMAAQIYQSGSTLSWGIMGGVREIPAMYEYSTIIFYSNRGINQAMTDWGALLRHYYDRDQSFTESDLTNNYLGYWTDNGAYYYYKTEPNKTYEQTIIDVKTYADKMNIPYKYVQFDSWWYYKGSLNGVVTWEGMPDVFPHGMQYLYNVTGWPVLAHNRWWSPKTTYAKQNGGKYNFIVEATKAIPQDPNFWPDLLLGGKKWGLITYEQDWLEGEFAGLNATLSTVNVARDWLIQMGVGAARNGLTIQYCMSNARHALQSLEISVVTQARVSRDYHPGETNWNIGTSSIFADSLGLRPFKDDFWTTSVEPGKYKSNETHTELEGLIATLSTGPVGPSDMIGATNVSLLMRCCNADGLILKPSRAARAIDSSIMEKAFTDGSGPDGEVWSTWSKISGYIFGTIVAPNQTNSVQVTPGQAGFGADFPSSVIYRHMWPTPSSPINFSDDSPLTISSCVLTDPCLWHTSPTLQFGGASVFLYGELGKWVPMSPKRVTNINVADDIYVTVVGAIGETIEFTFGVESGSMNTISCNLGNSGHAVIGHSSKSCNPL